MRYLHQLISIFLSTCLILISPGYGANSALAGMFSARGTGKPVGVVPLQPTSLGVDPNLGSQASALGLSETGTSAPETAPASAEQNLAALQRDIAQRVEVAHGPSTQKLPRIAVVAAGRLLQGKFPDGALAGESAKSLGVKLVKGLLESAALTQLKELDQKGTRVKIFFGAVDNSDSPDIAREIAVELGLKNIPGTGAAKNCGTSVEAMGIGMDALQTGKEDIVIAGGGEAMNEYPQVIKDSQFRKETLMLLGLPDKIAKSPWQRRVQLRFVQGWTWMRHKLRAMNIEPRYAITEKLKIGGIAMIETAETLARKYGISREEQDWFAYESQKRAIQATLRGDFADETIPYNNTRSGKRLTYDEGVRIGRNSRSGFRKLKTVIKKGENPNVTDPTVTPGNASQISDGASGVVLMREETARELGLVPLAYIAAVRDIGVDPREMGIGPAIAIPVALKAAGRTLADMQFVELNEAFAAQTLTVMRALGLSSDKVNPQGGAIALGHPLAASGTRITATSIFYAMSRGLTRWVISLCIGGGEGIAAVFERDPNMISRSFKEMLRLKLRARGVSEAVLDKVEATLNGLPPIFKISDKGHLETYRSAWNFVAEINTLASNGGSSLDSYSADLEAIAYNYGLIFVDRYMDARTLSDLDTALNAAYPHFKEAYEAEYGPGTYNIRGAMAHFAALSEYTWTKLERTARMPKALKTLFEPVHDLFNKALGLSDTADSHRDFSHRLEELGKGRIEDLPENGVLGRRLQKVLDLAKGDIALFGQHSKEFKYFKYVMDDYGVATVAISRAPVNAINMEVARELEQVLDRLEENPRVKTVVFTGEGKTFIAGADFNVIENIATAKDGEALSSKVQALFDRLEDFPKPVFMAVNGPAVGGGAEFVATGDDRGTSSLAEVGFREVGIGELPGGGGTQRAPRLVGLTTALTWMNSGQMVDAYTAMAVGFFDRVVEPSKVLAETQAEARKVAKLSDDERAEFVRARRTLSKPVRMGFKEWFGACAGWGTVIGFLAGAALGLWLLGPVALISAAFAAAWLLAIALPGYLIKKLYRRWGGLNPTEERFFDFLPLVAVLFGLPLLIPAGLAALGGLAGTRLMRGNGWLIRREVTKQTIKAGKKDYLHNIMRIIDAVLAGVKKGPRAGLKVEAKLFGQLAVRPFTKIMTALALRKYGGVKVKGVDEEMARPIKSVAVVGIGAMGAGIAEVTAHQGIPVTVKESDPASLARGIDRVRGIFSGLLKADKYSPQDIEDKMGLINGTVDEDELARSNPSIVIEAIPENQSLKEELFARLNAKLPPETILASNTSALSITELAKASGRPDRFLGIHYFNPVEEIPLVEVIVPDMDFTFEQWREHRKTLATALAFLEKTGRMVIVTRDSPGFAVNRILVPYINEAIRLVEEGATIEQVDRVMKKFGRMGPLELADHVGFPIGIKVGSYLEEKLPHLDKMSGLLSRLLGWGYAGKIGKDMRGFYTYKEVTSKSGKNKWVPDTPNEALIQEAVAVNRALAELSSEERSSPRALHEALADRIRYLSAILNKGNADLDALQALRRSMQQSQEAGTNAQKLASLLKAAQEAFSRNLESMRAEEKPGGVAHPFHQRLRAAYSSGARKISDQEIKERLLFLEANEASRVLQEGIVRSPKELDIAMACLGFSNATGGLLRYVSGLGLSHVAERLRYYASRGRGKAFEPSQYLLNKLNDYGGYRGIYNERQP